MDSLLCEHRSHIDLCIALLRQAGCMLPDAPLMVYPPDIFSSFLDIESVSAEEESILDLTSSLTEIELIGDAEFEEKTDEAILFLSSESCFPERSRTQDVIALHTMLHSTYGFSHTILFAFNDDHLVISFLSDSNKPIVSDWFEEVHYGDLIDLFLPTGFSFTSASSFYSDMVYGLGRPYYLLPESPEYIAYEIVPYIAPWLYEDSEGETVEEKCRLYYRERHRYKKEYGHDYVLYDPYSGQNSDPSILFYPLSHRPEYHPQPVLSVQELDTLRPLLTEDYYLVSEITEIYEKEYPNENGAKINRASLRALGFIGYNTCAVKAKWQSLTEYFEFLIHQDSILDLRYMPEKIVQNNTFTNLISSYCYRYDLIEFEPQQYIHIGKLNDVGLTIDSILSFRKSVEKFVPRGRVFTIESLRYQGFQHEIMDSPLSDYCLTRILLSNRIPFFSCRIGDARLLINGIGHCSVLDLVTQELQSQSAIDRYDLLLIGKEKYGLDLSRTRMLDSITKSNTLYYDKISEKIFISYEAYLDSI